MQASSYIRAKPRPPSRLGRRLIFSLAILAGCAGAALRLPAKTSEWKDMQGASFRADPVEVLGPFALFKTSPVSGRRVFLRGLSAEDCRRFYEETLRRPPRAATWAEAKGAATGDLVGRVLQVKNRTTLVPADLTKMPEPQLLLVLFGSHNDAESWIMVSNMGAVYNRVQRVFPGLMGAVFMGVRHNNEEHRQMAGESWMPWLVADLHEEAAMTQLSRFAPVEGTNMVLLSRDGVPLLGARATDLAAMRQFSDQLTDLLSQIDPANPRTWKDRVQYLAAERPVEFAAGNTGPLLVGNPLRADVLRQNGVTRITARLAVAANGAVTPEILPAQSVVPAPLVAPLTDALRRTVVLPAIDRGAPVAGVLDYRFDVPPEDRYADADAVWLSGELRTELPIDQWLVLRPIKVPEQNFTSEVDHETESGTVVFKPLQVSDLKVSRAAQMSAFNSDWFTAAGAASVAPKEGDKQRVDDADLTWQRIKPQDGLVDLRSGPANCDYSVGYAWAEFEAPATIDAWLGLGSDDGVKIWLNGELVHDKWIRRSSRIDDDVVPLRLKAGRNRILLKIQNATIDWSFLYRLRTRAVK